jgi:hypothetical protein
MFFAGYAKQQHGERNRGNAVAEEKSHTAVAQLSASGVGRKTKAHGSLAISSAIKDGSYRDVCVKRLGARRGGRFYK